MRFTELQERFEGEIWKEGRNNYRVRYPGSSKVYYYYAESNYQLADRLNLLSDDDYIEELRRAGHDRVGGYCPRCNNKYSDGQWRCETCMYTIREPTPEEEKEMKWVDEGWNFDPEEAYQDWVRQGSKRRKGRRRR